MKIVAVNSSRRKKNTYNLIQGLGPILARQGMSLEIINLFDYTIESCLGCEQCLMTDICPLKDDVDTLMAKLLAADGIILTSPVYLENVSGKMKSFIDRTCKWFHRPQLFGTPMMVMATTKGSGLKRTGDYLESVVVQWGGMPTDRVLRSIGTINQPVAGEEVRGFIRHLNLGKKFHKPRLSQMINFEVQKVLAKTLIGLDSQYWQSKGWTSMSYYYDCRIGFLKKKLSLTFGKFLDRKINGQQKDL